jgi:hypothetical protein
LGPDCFAATVEVARFRLHDVAAAVVGEDGDGAAGERGTDRTVAECIWNRDIRQGDNIVGK